MARLNCCRTVSCVSPKLGAWRDRHSGHHRSCGFAILLRAIHIYIYIYYSVYIIYIYICIHRIHYIRLYNVLLLYYIYSYIYIHTAYVYIYIYIYIHTVYIYIWTTGSTIDCVTWWFQTSQALPGEAKRVSECGDSPSKILHDFMERAHHIAYNSGNIDY